MTDVQSAPDDCKVFTPEPLAKAMAALLANRPGDRWLEPCVGKGIFLKALLDAGVRPSQITAVELDRHHGLEGWCGSYFPGTDFLGWACSTERQFDRIVGNPPYLPLHRVPTEIRGNALTLLRPGGGRVPPKANCWYAFLCACLPLLRPGGGLCFVLPSGWEYADYANDLREQLPKMFSRFEVFRSETSFFRGVLDGCVILIADGYGLRNEINRKLAFSGPDELIAHLLSADRPPATIQAVLAQEYSISSVTTPGLIRFGDIARIRIGAVTGATKYFLLTEPERRELNIPLADVRPVLTRARHLKAHLVIEKDWAGLRDAGERVWLFWPAVRRGRMARSVTEYLDLGVSSGHPLLEKVKVRSPWFQTRMPPHPDGFMSGMVPFGPWISLNRMEGLSATNTLYTVHFKHSLSVPKQAMWSLALISSTTAKQHATTGRRYSDGLLKFEPADVMNLFVPVPKAFSPRALLVYKRVITALRENDPQKARSLADSCIRGVDASQSGMAT